MEEAWGTNRHDLAKCRRLPEKSQVLAQVDEGPWGRVHLSTEGEEECRAQRSRGGLRSKDVSRGTRMQSGVAQGGGAAF